MRMKANTTTASARPTTRQSGVLAGGTGPAGGDGSVGGVTDGMPIVENDDAVCLDDADPGGGGTMAVPAAVESLRGADMDAGGGVTKFLQFGQTAASPLTRTMLPQCSQRSSGIGLRDPLFFRGSKRGRPTADYTASPSRGRPRRRRTGKGSASRAGQVNPHGLFS